MTTVGLFEECALIGSQIADLLGVITRSVDNRHRGAGDYVFASDG